jgi:hypothetical protein
MRVKAVPIILAACVMSLVPATASEAHAPDSSTSTFRTAQNVAMHTSTTMVQKGQRLPGGAIAQSAEVVRTACVPVGGVAAANCLTVIFHRHDATSETVTQIYAFKDNTTPFASYANLWRNVSIKECVDTNLISNPGNDVAEFRYAPDPAGAACGGARFYPDKTRFHVTWQNIPDVAHPIVFVP